MAPLTDKGLRKPDDPIYGTTTIVIGPLVRRPATSTAQGPRPENAPGKPAEPEPYLPSFVVRPSGNVLAFHFA